MKIVAGKFRGRMLCKPQGRDIRPTSDKVRGAVFNMLEARGAVSDMRVLDAFCGTGALGLEALSRGAAFCTFMDCAKSSLALAQENVRALGCESISQFQLCDVLKLKRKKNNEEAYDLIFLDPPYHKNILSGVLDVLIKSEWVKDGYIVCESEKGYDVPVLSPLEFVLEKTYGDIKITLLQCVSQ